jgi:hypothetical protein
METIVGFNVLEGGILTRPLSKSDADALVSVVRYEVLVTVSISSDYWLLKLTSLRSELINDQDARFEIGSRIMSIKPDPDHVAWLIETCAEGFSRSLRAALG